ncbi:MAG: heat-inducible transcription repressor HrcA [Ignavibacteria bacterium]|nr:heat-inducible transcription repressor HrcA [Ignavibacteria bacterium]
MHSDILFPKRESRELNDREKSILRSIVQMYILTANPIGSRFVSRYLEHEFKLSPATVRNVMSDLEEMEFIGHPHTSAGRIPTDKGYRVYVDYLMQTDHISESERSVVKDNLMISSSEMLLKDASIILGSLSKYLGVVELPNFQDVVVRRLQLIGLSSSRLLVVMELESNSVRTVTLEAQYEIDYRTLEATAQFINERISGKSIKFLKDNFAKVIAEADTSNPTLRLFIDSVDSLFALRKYEDKLHIAGTPNLLSHPEFEHPERMKGVIELVENEDVIIHLLEKQDKNDSGIKIAIGQELDNALLNDYSLVATTYQVGSASGLIGLIGPKRMNYSKMVDLVGYVSKVLSLRNNGG